MNIVDAFQRYGRGFCLGLVAFAMTVAGMIWSDCAEAAEIKRIMKRRGVVIVGGLTADDGVAVGSSICFIGGRGKKVACGEVTRMLGGGKAAAVKLKKKAFARRIKRNMTVEIDGAAGSSSSVAGSKGKKGGSADQPFRIGVLYMPGLTPAQYSNLTYLPPESTNVETLWKQTERMGFASAGFGFNVGVPIGPSMAYLFTVRYRIYEPNPLIDYYELGRQEPHTEIDQSATAIGIANDFQFLRVSSSRSFAFNLSGGLDIDISTVNYKVDRVYDGAPDGNALPDKNLVTATSTLNVASLRLGGNIESLFLGPAGLRFGLNLLVPLASFGQVLDAKIDDENAALVADPKGALADTLAHEKASFAAGIELGLLLGF